MLFLFFLILFCCFTFLLILCLGNLYVTIEVNNYNCVFFIFFPRYTISIINMPILKLILVKFLVTHMFSFFFTSTYL